MSMSIPNSDSEDAVAHDTQQQTLSSPKLSSASNSTLVSDMEALKSRLDKLEVSQQLIISQLAEVVLLLKKQSDRPIASSGGM